jgi:C1A family cysteine protease
MIWILIGLLSILSSRINASYENITWNQFMEFQHLFYKKYTSNEIGRRFEIFMKNVDSITTHNLNPLHNFTMRINQFADLTPEEFKQKYIGGGLKTSIRKICKLYSRSANHDDPVSVDWTQKNVVNPVRDQGQCGSCWAFATTANAESVWAIYTGELVDLSEQYLVDCATGLGYFNQGCNGGEPDSAFKFMIENGVCDEDAYPYTATDTTCKMCPIEFTFAGCNDVASNNQIDLRSAVAKNPVVVAIEADTRYFQFYSTGILTDEIKCGTNLDHAVEIVGYGEENGIKYWKVRNSWGETWGLDGYVKIERSESTNDPGVCGIAIEPSFIHL